MHWLTRMSLVNRWITFLIIIAIAVGSVFATIQLKTELFPDIELPYLVVFGLSQGTSPEDMESSISKPVEDEIEDIAGLKHIQSTSAESTAFVFATFDYGTDMAKAEDDIQSRLEAHPDLGTLAQSGDLITTRISFELIPLVWVTLSSENGLTGPELRAAAEELTEETSGMAGLLQEETPFMKRVEITGGQEDVQIIPNAEAMNALGIPVSWLIGAIQASPEYTSIQDIQEIPIGPVMLQDIAEVIEPLPDSYTDGSPSVSIIWRKDPDANTVDVANAIMAKVEGFRNSHSEQGIVVSTVMDQSEFIEESINDLSRDAIIGVILSGLVIFMFLWAFRASMIIIISIPMSLLIGFLLMYWFNITINILTLGGMAIAVGRIVDNSIVSLENIYRHLQRGKGFRSASIDGIKEVAMPITSATIATVAIFIPLVLVGGLAGEMFRPFALTVTFALLASLFIALVLVPPLSSFLSAKKVSFEGGDNWYTRAYTSTLGWSLDHRIITLVIALALFIGSILILPLVGTSFLPSGGENSMTVEIQMPYGNDSDVAQMIGAVEQKIEELKAEEEKVIGYHSYMGNPMGGIGGTVGLATITVELSGNADMEQQASALRDKCDLIQEISPTAITVTPGDPGAEMMASDRLEIRVIGEKEGGLDPVQEMTTLVTEKIQYLEDNGSIENLESELVTELTSITIDGLPPEAMLEWQWMRAGWPEIDKDGQLLYLVPGGTQMEIAGYGFDLAPAPQVSLGNGYTADVYVSRVVTEVAGTTDTERLDNIKQLRIGATSPTPPSLSDIANVDWGPKEYNRAEGGYAGTIVAKITADDVGSVAREVKDLVDGLELPEGVAEIKLGGVAEQMMEGFADMGIAIILAIVIVFLVMAVSFRSWLTPLIIMFTLPLASMGAVLGLLVTGRPMGMSAMMGILMLVGIVLTNAIVLLTFVEDRRKERYSTRKALMDAGKIRLRPILMTALTTMIALVPLSLGISEGGLIAAELGVVVIGGLFSSTLLTLLVIPVLYSLTDRIRRNPYAERKDPTEPWV